MGDGNGFHVGGFHVNDVVYILNGAFDQQEFSLNNGEAVFVQDIGRDNDVGNTGLVFEAEEDETFCRSRTLTGDHATGYADAASMRHPGQIDCAKNASAV